MREVAQEMSKERSRDLAACVKDELGWAIRFVPAAETANVSSMKSCVEASPHLGSLVGLTHAELREDRKLAAVRDHVVDLARRSLSDDLQAFGVDTGDGLAEVCPARGEYHGENEEATSRRESRHQCYV